MGDNVSLSLDDYIKRQKRQNPKKGAATKNQIKGKPKAGNQPSFRYYQGTPAVNANRGQNTRVGRGKPLPGRKAVGRPGNNPGGGGFSRKQRGQFNKKKNINNNRLNTIRPTMANLDVRARRFAGSVTARNFTQALGGAVRNQPRNKRNWKRNATRSFTNNNLVPRNNINTFQQRNSGRFVRPKGNVRLQKLIKKRIKNARSLLASKVLAPRNQRLAPALKSRRNIGLLVGSPLRQNRLLSQQKLNRAKLIRTRIRNNKLQRTGGSLKSRGLSVDRNNLVRVRVANDLRQNYGPPASQNFYSPQYAPLMPPPPHFHDLPDPEFPPFTMHNTSPPVDEMEVCRSSLDPNIQRKISVIQNRARNSNMSPARVMSDFKAPVSSSAMKLGDRFRMMMR